MMSPDPASLSARRCRCHLSQLAGGDDTSSSEASSENHCQNRAFDVFLTAIVSVPSPRVQILGCRALADRLGEMGGFGHQNIDKNSVPCVTIAQECSDSVYLSFLSNRNKYRLS